MAPTLPSALGDMQLRSRALSYYKHERIRELIAKHAQDKEVGIRFNDRFKRPDAVRHASDVLELAMQGATSFHASEERWTNPLLLAGNPSKKDLDPIRTGWDLILDIDCVDWELAKAITATFIEALRQHGITSITCKFSGNKGFHIGVPFESFPEAAAGKKTRTLFPEGPRAIASYLLEFIEYNNLVISDHEGIIFRIGNHGLSDVRKKFLFEHLPKQKEVLLMRRCAACKRPAPAAKGTQYEHLCENERCGHFFIAQAETLQCPRCKFPLRITKKEARCACTPAGKQSTFVSVVDLGALLDLDTLLISSRHLCRMAYSLHEKSGLVSLPLFPAQVMLFDKAQADPAKVISLPDTMRILFLDAPSGQRAHDAATLLERALEYSSQQQSSEQGAGSIRLFPKEVTSSRYDEELSEKVPETCFPPCMQLLLGKLADGKKRAMFILTNFLAGCNWTPAEIEERLKVWNSKQDEPLRDTILLGHVRYHAARSKAEKTPPPPNCDKYYPDLHVCKPDNLCKMIKNPLQYAKRKARYLNSQSKQNGNKKRKGPAASSSSQDAPPDIASDIA